MSETIHVRGEGGAIFKLALPLHETIAEKLAKGDIVRVTADGATFVEGEPSPAVKSERGGRRGARPAGAND